MYTKNHPNGQAVTPKRPWFQNTTIYSTFLIFYLTHIGVNYLHRLVPPADSDISTVMIFLICIVYLACLCIFLPWQFWIMTFWSFLSWVYCLLRSSDLGPVDMLICFIGAFCLVAVYSLLCTSASDLPQKTLLVTMGIVTGCWLSQLPL